ncbi:hypothetical protein JCM8202_005706 [Rhodotorula sphaerocarpa]
MIKHDALVALTRQSLRGLTGTVPRQGSGANLIASGPLHWSRPAGQISTAHLQTSLYVPTSATPAARLFATCAVRRARLVDAVPALAARPERGTNGPWPRAPPPPPGLKEESLCSLAGETAKALWRQAKARVEAKEGKPQTSFRAWCPPSFRPFRRWRERRHGFDSRGRAAGKGSATPGAPEGKACGGGGHAAPVSGCRTSSPGWCWYLAANERRRRDPKHRAHFRHVYRTLHPLAPDPGSGCFSTVKARWRHRDMPSDIPWHYRAGRRRPMTPREFRQMMREHYASRDRAVRRVKRILMRFCAQSPNASCRRTGRHRPRERFYEHHRSGGDRSQGKGSLHDHHRGNFRFSDPNRPFRDGKRGANMIQAGVGTDEYRSATIMSVRASASLQRPRLYASSPRCLPRPIGQTRTAAATTTIRTFSASSRRPSALVNVVPTPSALPWAEVLFCPVEMALPLLLPLATILKSSATLNVLAAVTRISLTLLPLSVRGKIVHVLRERYLRDPASLSSSIWARLSMKAGGTAALETPSSFLTRWNALIGLPLLLLTPLVLLALVAIASLERTPITGRWRVVMLSPAEEAELVDSIFAAAPASASTGAVAPAPEGTSRDWVQILRHVLQLPDEGLSPETGRRRLLGGEVLDQRDWRVRWTEAVLRALEKGGLSALTGTDSSRMSKGSALPPPPTDYPLELRPEALTHRERWRDELVLAKPFEAHQAHRQGAGPALAYDLLVIENDSTNAFSFGFGPGPVGEATRGVPRRGVIVVYTGFLREILGGNEATPPPKTSAAPPRRSFFDGLKGAAPASNAPPDSISAHLVPAVLPTDAQTKSLAVLLSHELAHLTLSHTLESYASTNLLLPHLARLTTDVIRTVLYPVTAIFGPFLNDALGGVLNESARGGLGVIGQAVNSCESRKLESEADVVALRLLSAAGIDPRVALSFWENRLPPSIPPDQPPSAPSSPNPPPVTLASTHPLRLHSTHDTLDGLLRSHPVDTERVQRIRDELADWEAWWQRNAPRAAPAIPATPAGAATA